MKTVVFVTALALSMVPMNAIGQEKREPSLKKEQSVCVPINLNELPKDSPDKFMADIAKAMNRPFTCTKCTTGDSVRVLCAMGCPPGGTC